jgi:hypothetical protein
MAGIVRGSLDQPPIVVRRGRGWSLLILPVALAVASCLLWGVRVVGMLDETARVLTVLPVLVCTAVAAICAIQIAHPSVLTISPEGIAQRRGGAMRKRRWADITGLAVSEEEPQEPEEDVELGVESAGAETLWLDQVFPADQLEALIRAAQARWAPDVVIGPRRRSMRMERLLLAPALAAVLVFAASVALPNHQVRDLLGFGRVARPWWLTAQAALVALGFAIPLISRPARSDFFAWLAGLVGLLLLAAMVVAVAVLGFYLWSAAIAALGLTHAQLALFFRWIGWGLAVIASGIGALIGLLLLLSLGGFAWRVLTRRRAEAR